jgi:hypothetical protein
MLMNRSSAKKPPPLDRSTAWGFLVTNAAAPGLGSLAAGRAVGYFQFTFGMLGSLLSALALTRILVGWFRLDQSPVSGEDFRRLIALWRGHLVMGAAGFLLFLVSWIWALVTSLHLLRNAVPPELPK